MPRRIVILFSAVVLLLAAALGTYAFLTRYPPAEGSGTALVGGAFSLVNQDGKRVTEKDFLGKFALVFFGYTYCPDVCPTELQVMMAALDSMKEDGLKIQPVFVSVDPERDRPEVIKAYVENFGPRLVGLTGSAEEIAQIATAYRVYYAKAGKTNTEDYMMDHSSIIYLMGPDGRFARHFTYTTDAAELARALKEALAAYR
jgi:cytochrome oxidase Cu insertion factor (SCO1/SenC/PrrC family)